MAKDYYHTGLAVSRSDCESMARNVRKRHTLAEVIAGVTLLPAIPGYQYRLIDVTMISTEANAATATSIDITGTQSGSDALLLVNAVGGLTDSAALRMGHTNSAVLADGASYIACDANTAITLIDKGTTLTGTVNLDTIITYAVEKEA